MRGIKLDYNSILGKTYGGLTVLRLWKKVWYHQWIICKCNECWKEIETRAYHVLKWKIKSCWCLNIKHKDVIWQRYWRLTIIGEEEKRDWRRMVRAKCDCWKTITTYLHSILHWHPISCWCVFYDVMKKSRKYGENSTRDMRIYGIWRDILGRVKGFSGKKHYFDKWIKCLRKDFSEFYKDMWESYENHVKQYWEDNTTIDRIDCNWDYCKENCRWATWQEQYLNRDCMKLTE